MRNPCWTNDRLRISIAKADATESVTVERPYAVFGDGDVCDVAVNGSLSLKRCFLACATADGIYGVSLAYRRSPRRFKLIDPDRGIRIGAERFRFEILRDESQPNSAREDVASESDSVEEVYPALRWTGTGKRKSRVRLRPHVPLLFGRNLPCPLRIDDSAVSNVHGFVVRTDADLWIVDLGSSNGTFIDGQPITTASVSLGRTFRVGLTTVEFVAPNASRRSTKTRVAPEANVQVIDANQQSAFIAEMESARQQLTQLQEERDELQKELDCHRQQSAELAAFVSRWQRQLDEREQEFIAWQTRQRIELHEREESLRKKTDEETQLGQVRKESLDDRESELFGFAEELEGRESELELEKRALETNSRELGRRESELDQEAQRVEDEKQQIEALRREILAERQQNLSELEVADERLLVRRIRLQRERESWEQELKKRDSELKELEQQIRRREAELSRREDRLAERAQTLKKDRLKMTQGDNQQRWRVSNARHVPTGERGKSPTESQHDAARDSELVNPLLESADFHEMLEGVSGAEFRLEDDDG